MIRTFEELKECQEHCAEQFKTKITGASGKRAVVLCGGTGCLSSNSDVIRKKFEVLVSENHLEDKITVNQVGCFGFCSQGPFVKIFPEDTLYRLVTIDDVDEIFAKDLVGGQIVERLLYEDPNTGEKVPKQDDINFYKKQHRIALEQCGQIDPENIHEALGTDAFAGLAKALSMDRQEVINIVLASGLRGRGGAGFPTGRKWQFAYAQPEGQKYVVCNGDEGDPGAFMDRSILEGNPLEVIEGMMIAGYAIGAQNGYFYVRAEYPVAVSRLRKGIRQAEEMGLLGDHILGTDFSFRCHVRLGAGAFVCGEETALLGSIEGRRGMPRTRPPFPAVEGLWHKPTIVNNVETLSLVPYILRNGAEKFASIGTAGSKGTKVFALGGKINNVGLVEVPMGTTLRELIYDIGGGIPDGKKFKAIQTGGPSGGCLTEKDLDCEIDFDTLRERGSMMGSGGAIVMDEDNCMVDVAKFYMDFICDESCGKCTQCRIGTRRLLEYLEKICNGQGTLTDLDEMRDLAAVIQVGALCALGQTAANPVLSTFQNFHDEYVEHIVNKKCPAKVCKNLMEYKIDPDLCRGCSACARQCPADCIHGEIKSPFTIDASACIKCGTCISVCKFGAVYKD
ncbi:MAG: NADH-quinone oxidoreductase subunit NuoF [Parasporobacterium sp.]|nr:NADH-quinone oxidoreductase subunit NuoF [Parasporobacterium sp.]